MCEGIANFALSTRYLCSTAIAIRTNWRKNEEREEQLDERGIAITYRRRIFNEIEDGGTVR